jgi:hypothetical protein
MHDPRYSPKCEAVLKTTSRQQIDQPVNDDSITSDCEFDGSGVDAKPDEEPTFLEISDLKTFRRFHVYKIIFTAKSKLRKQPIGPTC